MAREKAIRMGNLPKLGLGGCLLFPVVLGAFSIGQLGLPTDTGSTDDLGSTLNSTTDSTTDATTDTTSSTTDDLGGALEDPATVGDAINDTTGDVLPDLGGGTSEPESGSGGDSGSSGDSGSGSDAGTSPSSSPDSSSTSPDSTSSPTPGVTSPTDSTDASVPWAPSEDSGESDLAPESGNGSEDESFGNSNGSSPYDLESAPVPGQGFFGVAASLGIAAAVLALRRRSR